MNIQVEALKLKVLVEHLDRARTLDNAVKLLHGLKSLKNANLQFIQDFLLTRLLTIMQSTDKGGRNVNEFKTTLIQCMNVVISNSKIIHELPYKTILSLITNQLYDHRNNIYKIELSEELKMAIFDCLEVSSRNLDSEVVESFMVKANQFTIGHCLYVCKEAIVKETYMKIRKKAIEALMALSQCHDNADPSDIVLREQISKVLFVVLPKVSLSLIKVCCEDTLRGPHLIEAAVKTLGRFLTLIFQDYGKQRQLQITNANFLQLVDKSAAVNEKPNVAKIKAAEQEKTDEWLQSAATNISKLIVNLKTLRINKHREIRYELAVMSSSMLYNCLPHIEQFMRFLLENLIVLSVDSDTEIQAYSQQKLSTELIPRMNQEVSDLFMLHLNGMPRTLMTGLDAEKLAGITLLSSYISLFSSNPAQFDTVLSNSFVLEKFLNILVSCCELESPVEYISFETSVTDNLIDNQYYQLRTPWKRFKHLSDDASIKAFSDVCRHLARSKSAASMCVNYIVDHINSIEHVVCLVEILACDDAHSSIESDTIEHIFEEFLSDAYWNLPIKSSPQLLDPKNTRKNDQWYKDSTLGLYESAIEVRLYDRPYNSEEMDHSSISLRTLNYNILCTCIIVELTGKVALKLDKSFQKFHLRCLHRVLEKAGSSNFLIKSAGLYALNCIKEAMSFTDLSQLIDENSSFLLFNVHKLLRNSKENESILDMLSMIFRYSRTSINDYVDDIVEMATHQITGMKKYENSRYHLRLFELYVRSLSSEIAIEDLSLNEVLDWSDFAQNCIDELNTRKENKEEEEEEEQSHMDESENPDQDQSHQEATKEEEEKEKLPLHVELILRILNTSLPFFASADQSEVISVHEIFRLTLPILHVHEKEFLPMIHKMWYPFTKQFQGSNFVILQHSVQLLTVVAHYAKDFIYKKSINNIIPTINKFLKSSHGHTNSCENYFYTQEFKLQKEILGKYGELSISLGVDDQELDEIISILNSYNKHHSNDQLRDLAKGSLDLISHTDPMLVSFKLNFE